MALGQSEGMKTHIKMQPYLLEPIRPESLANLPKGFKKVIKFKPVAHKVSIIDVNDISTVYDLAFFIRHNPDYGFGLWSLGFYDRLKNNKHFKSYFECVGKTCRYWDGCKMKKRKLANPKKFKTCKLNPKIRANWSSRAWIEITPKNNATGDDDFKFKFFKNRNQMYKFWFWGSDKHGKKKRPKEDMYF